MLPDALVDGLAEAPAAAQLPLRCQKAAADGTRPGHHHRGGLPTSGLDGSGGSSPRAVQAWHTRQASFSSCTPSTAAATDLPLAEEATDAELAVGVSSAASTSAASDGALDTVLPPLPDCSGRYGIDYLRHPVAAYCHFPAPLRQIMKLPGLKHFMVVARPTIEPSGGLLHYRLAVPKDVRRRAPLLAVVDEPGLAADELAGEGGKYHWVEIPIPPVYRLDLGDVRSYAQYVDKVMGRNQRRNHKLRQQKWAEASVLTCEYVRLAPGDEALVRQLWRLYKQNGDRNGYTVVCKPDFFRIHLAADMGLSVMMVRDTSRGGGALVSFATGVKCGDTLISTWCGTDYAHPLSRTCSTYIMTQYEFVRQAIEDPDVRWLDFGALHRTVKHGSLCAQPHAVSTYVRCKSAVVRRLVQGAARRWFSVERLLAAGVVTDV